MPLRDFKSQRLYCNVAMKEVGKHIYCTPAQANYILHSLRLRSGDTILIFNGYDGEWCARLNLQSKKKCSLELLTQVRRQTIGPDIQYLFAPLKRERLDYMVQKATELGVASINPIYTKHTVANRVNLDRIRINTVKAAEQCGILHIPDIRTPERLVNCLKSWDPERNIIFADENANSTSPIKILEKVGRGKIAVLIGPEGGFSDSERKYLLNQPFVKSISLGPRIMRADTAAIAVLTLVNAVLGDWQAYS